MHTCITWNFEFQCKNVELKYGEHGTKTDVEMTLIESQLCCSSRTVRAAFLWDPLRLLVPLFRNWHISMCLSYAQRVLGMRCTVLLWPFSVHSAVTKGCLPKSPGIHDEVSLKNNVYVKKWAGKMLLNHCLMIFLLVLLWTAWSFATLKLVVLCTAQNLQLPSYLDVSALSFGELYIFSFKQCSDVCMFIVCVQA